MKTPRRGAPLEPGILTVLTFTHLPIPPIHQMPPSLFFTTHCLLCCIACAPRCLMLDPLLHRRALARLNALSLAILCNPKPSSQFSPSSSLSTFCLIIDLRLFHGHQLREKKYPAPLFIATALLLVNLNMSPYLSPTDETTCLHHEPPGKILSSFEHIITTCCSHHLSCSLPESRSLLAF